MALLKKKEEKREENGNQWKMNLKKGRKINVILNSEFIVSNDSSTLEILWYLNHGS